VATVARGKRPAPYLFHYLIRHALPPGGRVRPATIAVASAEAARPTLSCGMLIFSVRVTSVGLIVKAGSLGLIGDVIVGLVGAAIAGYLLPRMGALIGTGFVSEVINAVIGAVILLLIVRLAKGMTTKSA
jgi:uncharacterized membrane protein YeaQ/YmgE (transglycosylase-associated protein family)